MSVSKEFMERLEENAKEYFNLVLICSFGFYFIYFVLEYTTDDIGTIKVFIFSIANLLMGVFVSNYINKKDKFDLKFFIIEHFSKLFTTKPSKVNIYCKEFCFYYVTMHKQR